MLGLADGCSRDCDKLHTSAIARPFVAAGPQSIPGCNLAFGNTSNIPTFQIVSDRNLGSILTTPGVRNDPSPKPARSIRSRLHSLRQYSQGVCFIHLTLHIRLLFQSISNAAIKTLVRDTKQNATSMRVLFEREGPVIGAASWQSPVLALLAVGGAKSGLLPALSVSGLRPWQ